MGEGGWEVRMLGEGCGGDEMVVEREGWRYMFVRVAGSEVVSVKEELEDVFLTTDTSLRK